MIALSLASLVAFFRRTTASIVLICVLALPMAISAFASDGDASSPTGRLITSAAIVINPETQKVYAVDAGAQSVSVVDIKTEAKVIVPVGDGPIALAVN